MAAGDYNKFNTKFTHYSWVSVLQHVTFIMSYLLMTFILMIKFMEWYRAIEIIKKENKLDEEIVKIHLFD